MQEEWLVNLMKWEYWSIPFVAAFIGWVTNWVAIKMMFYPIEFWGWKPLKLGWQGVIPSKAEKMAKTVVKTGLQSLVSVQEVYDQLDKNVLAQAFLEAMERRLEEYVEDVMMRENQVMWDNLPVTLKNKIYVQLRKELPSIVQGLISDTTKNIENLFDLEDMVVKKLTQNKHLLNQIFQEAGDKEFKFIINAGFYFGFLFGLLQLAIWLDYPAGWILPTFGFIGGVKANWLALKIIFSPLEPIKFGPFVLQGLFLKRQKEVARVLCRITTHEVITMNNMLHNMLTGPKSERTNMFMHQRISQAVDNVTSSIGFGLGRPMLQTVLGLKGYASLKNVAKNSAIIFANQEIGSNQQFSDGQKEIINDLLRSRMEKLSSREFRDVLRPAFEEDEWILILVGGVLGLITGIIQYYVTFS